MDADFKTIIRKGKKAQEHNQVCEKILHFLIEMGEESTHNALMTNGFNPVSYEVEDLDNGDFILSITYHDESTLAQQITSFLDYTCKNGEKRPISLNYTLIYENGIKRDEMITYIPRFNSHTEIKFYDAILDRFNHLVGYLGYDSEITINRGFKLTSHSIEVLETPGMSYLDGEAEVRTVECENCGSIDQYLVLNELEEMDE